MNYHPITIIAGGIIFFSVTIFAIIQSIFKWKIINDLLSDLGDSGMELIRAFLFIIPPILFAFCVVSSIYSIGAFFLFIFTRL